MKYRDRSGPLEDLKNPLRTVDATHNYIDQLVKFIGEFNAHETPMLIAALTRVTSIITENWLKGKTETQKAAMKKMARNAP